MLKLPCLVLASVLTGGFAIAASAAPEASTAVRQHWFQGIAAGYQSLAREAHALEDSASAYCHAPTPGAREAVAESWRSAFLAWQAIRFVDFGPIEQDNRAWQFQFWPDSKNLIGHKANILLRQNQDIGPDTVSQGSVAVQGFPMIEYLLFDVTLTTGENALPAERTCQLLTSVAAQIRMNSDQLNADWATLRPHYLDNNQYTDTTIRAAMAALEILEERRLANPMGLRGNGKRSIYSADAWRSGQSLATIQATTAGLYRHFLPAFVALLEARGHADLAQRIDKQFQEVLDHFPDLNQPMAPLLADDAAFVALQSLYVDVSQLTNLVNGQAAVELGVVRGFNSSDGD